MGAWIAGQLAADHEVGVYDLDPDKARRVPGSIAVERPADWARFRPDLLVNAVSLTRVVEAFETALPHLPPATMLADLASVKGALPDFYARWGGRFVSVHPMFGPTFADLGSPAGEHAVLIRESDPAGRRFFRRFFRGLGLMVSAVSFEEHDRMIAYALALPFVSTLVFAGCLTGSAVPGTTFRKHLAIAAGLLGESDDLLAEVLFNPPALEQLERITGRLEFLKHIIRQRDGEEAARLFRGLREKLRPYRDNPAGRAPQGGMTGRSSERSEHDRREDGHE